MPSAHKMKMSNRPHFSRQASTRVDLSEESIRNWEAWPVNISDDDSHINILRKKMLAANLEIVVDLLRDISPSRQAEIELWVERGHDLANPKEAAATEFSAVAKIPAFEVAGWHHMFAIIDANKDGHISSDELREYLRSTSADSTEEEVETSFQRFQLDQDEDGYFTRDEFITCMTRIYTEEEESKEAKKASSSTAENVLEQTSTWRRMFFFFDSKGSGALTTSAVQQVLKELNLTLTQKQIKKLYASFVHSESLITFEQFLPMIRRLMTDQEFHSEILKTNRASFCEAYDQLLSGTFVVDPQSKFGFRWTFVTMVLVVYSAFLIPARLAFDSTPGIITTAIDIISELWFILDIAVNFFTAFPDSETGILVTDRERIKTNYLHSWFLIDTLSSIPVVILSMFLPTEQFAVLRILRMAKLFRLLRLMNLKALNHLEDSGYLNPSFIRLFKILATFLFVLHLVACIYWSVVTNECILLDDSNPHSETSTPNWCPDAWRLGLTGHTGEIRAGLMDKYWPAMYWAIMAMLGDNALPSSNGQFLVCIFMSFLGIAVFSTIIGSLSSMLSSLDSAKNAKTEQMGAINGYLRSRRVDAYLCKKIRNYYSYLWQSGLSNHQKDLFEELPIELTLELTVLLKEDLLFSVPLFQQLEAKTLMMIIKHLEPRICMPNQAITEMDQVAESMLLLGKGHVGIYVKGADGADMLISTRHSGFCFGVVDFFGARKRQSTVKALSHCELDVLAFSAIEGIMEVCEDLKRATQAHAKQHFASLHILKRAFDYDQLGAREKGTGIDILDATADKKHQKNGARVKGKGGRRDSGYKNITTAITNTTDANGKLGAAKRVKRLSKKHPEKRAEVFGELLSMFQGQGPASPPQASHTPSPSPSQPQPQTSTIHPAEAGYLIPLPPAVRNKFTHRSQVAPAPTTSTNTNNEFHSRIVDDEIQKFDRNAESPARRVSPLRSSKGPPTPITSGDLHA